MSDSQPMPESKIKVGVVGATGAVGEVFLSLIEERDFPAGEIRLFASEDSRGQTRSCLGTQWPVKALYEGCFDGLDVVFFSSGDEISLEWAPRAMQAGAIVIDNSAAFRDHADYPLIVPEVNGHLLPKVSVAKVSTDRLANATGTETRVRDPHGKATIIANPNCSTIQLVVALAPLAHRFGLDFVRVATYQSVSGAGRAGLEELMSTSRLALEGEDVSTSETFPASIAFNCVPQIGRIGDDGFSSEETKIMTETRKILGLPGLRVSAFTVRVPTFNGHAEVVWVTLGKDQVTGDEFKQALAQSPGLKIGSSDTTGGPDYPTQRTTSGQDPVFIGRIHRDRDDSRTWMFWVVADNLRKGAALNGLQIAERIFDFN